MQKMYVANCTRQSHIFMYRLPETPSTRQQTINIGGQERIGSELSTTDIEAIIRQHAKYGMISVEEAKKTRAYAPTVYSLDKPVSSEIIKMMADRNTGELQDRGREIRKDAAIVMTNQLGANMRERGFEDALEEIEVDFTEDDDANSRNRRAATGDDRLREKVVVTRDDVLGKKGRGRNRGGRN